MTFVEFCEKIFRSSLPEWQKALLERAYSVYEKTGTPYVFVPRRGNGKSMTEAIVTELLILYSVYRKETNDERNDSMR